MIFLLHNSMYHKLPRVCTTGADLEMYRPRTFWTVADVGFPIRAAMDASKDSATGEMNADERPNRFARLVGRVWCRGAGKVELVVPRIVHVLLVCRCQIAGITRRTISEPCATIAEDADSNRSR